MIITTLKSEFRRRMEVESLSRIHKCIDNLNHEQLWYTPNDNVNSVANLVLHLSGNIRQYILTTFAGNEDTRIRDKEFVNDGNFTHSELKELIGTTIQKSVNTVNKLTEEELNKDYAVQCFNEHGVSILVHVIEHCSYHTGQITQMTKWLKDMDTQYYPDSLDLNKKGNE